MMTVSALAQIEACPRRWALNAASYPELWSQRGYPPRPNPRAVEGTVVHSAVERITNELVRDACPSSQDPSAVQTLRRMGGYTAIVNGCIETTLERLAQSPRIPSLLSFMTRSLRGKMPELRARVQTMLSRARLPALNAPGTKGPHRGGGLRPGAYTEIDLRAVEIGWRGKADLLVVFTDSCEITDFKTGAPDSSHQFQMEVYSLLWSLDTELNPTNRPVNRLTLAYTSEDIDVRALPPSRREEFKVGLTGRTAAARLAVSTDPPPARPSFDNCAYCTVRQLCGEFWTTEVQHKMKADIRASSFVDIELEMIGPHGPKSWDSLVVCSSFAQAGTRVLVRYIEPPIEFQTGQRVRLLSVNATADEPVDPGQPTIIVNIGALSEAFVVAF